MKKPLVVFKKFNKAARGWREEIERGALLGLS
jgi:hypothetical protein